MTDKAAADVHSPLTRPIGVVLWAVFGLALIVLLFRLLSISLSEAVLALFGAPLWVYGAVFALTVLNKVVGALKWRAAECHLSGSADQTGFLTRVELTNLGAIFGQVMPVQLANVLVRWLLLGRRNNTSGRVVGATMFEQLFDLFFVLAGAAAFLSFLLLDLPLAWALAMFTGLALLCVIALGPVLRIAQIVLRGLERFAALSGVCEKASAAIALAAAAPTSVLIILSGYSFVRLVIVGLRAVVVIGAFAPATAALLVFLATPSVSLLTTLPLTPGGLGVAEWSWSAILILGGALAGEAAVAALGLRLITFGAMLLNAIGLRALSYVRRERNV